MIRPTIDPVVTKDADRDSTTAVHPAFGMIRASLCSGETVLHGSDFIHQHFVRSRQDQQ